ncbi:hypothetical protein [Mycobacterium phage WXIN]|nr:hypothetical protein [Mycobacterium phage WXIN]
MKKLVDRFANRLGFVRIGPRTVKNGVITRHVPDFGGVIIPDFVDITFYDGKRIQGYLVNSIGG